MPCVLLRVWVSRRSDCELGDRKIVVRFPGKANNISLIESVQSGLAIHPNSYSMGSGDISLAIKRPEREVINLLPSRAKFKNIWSRTSIPPYAYMPCIETLVYPQ
jgi:hypothetical protein